EGRTAVEWGPDSFLASKPAARELAQELGLELVAPSPAGMRAYLLIDDELRPFPSGTVMGVPRGPVMALAAIRSGVIGLGAAVRAAIEPLLPGTIGDESVSAVTRRRLGTRWSERLVEPLAEGVYGAPAGQL